MSINTNVLFRLPVDTHILERDIMEINICSENQAFKATMVMCGSVLEYVLGESLSLVDNQLYLNQLNQLIERQEINVRRRTQTSIENLSLYERLLLARTLNMLDRETYGLCQLLRDYRNLIHPSIELRTLIEPNERRSDLSVNALNQAIEKISDYFSTREVYVLNIRDIDGHFIRNKEQVIAGVTNITQERGLNLNIIENEDQLLDLVCNPPRLAIIINAHGERVYVPSNWNRHWREFYQRIGENVRDQGWIFVSIAGYPFYYYGSRLEERSGTDGLNVFLSVVGARANCMTSGAMRFTDEGLEVLREFRMTALPLQLAVQRCALWENIEPVMKFLADRDLCGASAIRMGRGFFIQIGLDDIFAGGLPADYGARVLGGLAAGFSLFLIS